MHPHWQSDEEVPVRVVERVNAPPNPEVGQMLLISRRPAAIIGIVLVLGLGFFFFHGVDALRGQLGNEESEERIIRIGTGGPLPRRLEVEHGQTITWVNDLETPVSFASQTLCSDTGFCLQSGILLPGDEMHFTITPDIRSGPYAYASADAPELRGEVIVITETVEDFATRSAADDFIGNPLDSVPAEQAGTQPPVASVQIPRNPYTVTGDKTHPFDSSGEPIPEAFGESSRAPMSPLLSVNNRPMRQPQTGPGVWIVIALSIVVLWHFTRDCFALRGLLSIMRACPKRPH